MVQGIIAGGNIALIESQEGSEDQYEQGALDLIARGFSSNDVACGIALLDFGHPTFWALFKKHAKSVQKRFT